MSTAVLSIQRAKESVQPCPTEDARLQRVNLRTQQLAHTRTELASILPVEGTTGREAVQQRIELLELVIKNPAFEERYPYLSMEVLGWRNEQGLPKLVPFSLTDPLFSIEASYNWIRGSGKEWQIGGSIQNLPQPMARLCGDVAKRFQNEFREDLRNNRSLRTGSWSKSITAQFSGIIPQWVREKIQQCAADFSVSTPRVEIGKVGWLRKREVTKIDVATNIFLIAEVDKWTSKLVLRPDPLVVGYRAGCLWFICSFDETPLENYVRMEFTV